MYVCVCNGVTDKEIRQAVESGHDSLDALCEQLRVGACCGRCQDCANRLIQSVKTEHGSSFAGVGFA